MAIFASRHKQARLTKPHECLAGFVHDEDGHNIPAHNFVGRQGQVIEYDDTGYDTSYPTGEETIYYLINFDGQRVWVDSTALTFVD